jgi:hypothetical protein
MKSLFKKINGMKWYWRVPVTIAIGGVGTAFSTGLVYLIIQGIAWVGGARALLYILCACLAYFMGQLILSIYDGTSSGR